MQDKKDRQLSIAEKAFKRRLRESILSMGKKSAFARGVGVSLEQANKWIDQERNTMPSIQFLLRICDYVGSMKMVYIVTGRWPEEIVEDDVRNKILAELDTVQNVLNSERERLVSGQHEYPRMVPV